MTEISLSRIKYLLLMQTAGKTYNNLKRTVLYLIVGSVVISILLALFFLWLDPGVEILGNMMFLIYMMTSYSLLSFLNTDKNREIEFLMLPASAKEKIIAHIIQAFVNPTVILTFTILAMIFFQGRINLNAGQDFFFCMPILEALTLVNILTGLLLQSLFGFATLTFRKWAWVIGIIIILLVIIPIIATKQLLNMEGVTIFLFNGILLILTILVWIANYYKLKKREI